MLCSGDAEKGKEGIAQSLHSPGAAGRAELLRGLSAPAPALPFRLRFLPEAFLHQQSRGRVEQLGTLCVNPASFEIKRIQIGLI